jgi:small subunit ribosomal protein S20
MAHSAQARKRARQSDKRRLRNKSVRNAIKSLTKSLAEKIQAKDGPGAQALFRTVVSQLDKASRKHVYHRNTAARHKSRVAAMLKGLS